MKNTYTVEGYILAGGKSRRMGEDKGLIPYYGMPMVKHVIDQLNPAVDKLTIITEHEGYKQFGLDTIPDLIKDIGPAGGIYTALKNATSDKIFITGCDMPFIKTEAIAFMIQSSEDSEITVPVWDKNPEPLFAVYSKECLPLWEELIKSGIHKLQRLIASFNLKEIRVNDSEILSADMFTNINTPDDFIKAKSLTDGN
jgi:molybdopterin-guanine dinucleotide biosynthesis protein A